MDTLKDLVSRHRFVRIGMPYSNTLRDPTNPIVQHVQTLFPWATCVCLNRKRSTSPPMVAHRGKGNTSASMIAFLGDYDSSDGQGALCLEDGREYREKEVWHGPYQGDQVTHWVRGHSSGTRYSCVVFSGPARSTRCATRPEMRGYTPGDKIA